MTEDVSKSPEGIFKLTEDVFKSPEDVSKLTEDIFNSTEDVSKLIDNKFLSKNIFMIKYFNILSEKLDNFIKLFIIL